MKTFHFHPASLLAGLALGAGVLLLTSQVSTVTFPNARVEVGPHPRDMVQIQGGVPYTVPPGRIFVLTALGCLSGSNTTELRVNSQIELVVSPPQNGDVWIHDVPKCMTAHWGSVIEVSAGNGTAQARAWGYLADR